MKIEEKIIDFSMCWTGKWIDFLENVYNKFKGWMKKWENKNA